MGICKMLNKSILNTDFIVQGTKAFCSGGDQLLRKKDGYADFESFGRLNVLDLQVNDLNKFIF